MSGDVQPRKRKDKKRKKDELGVEEHRGTAAALGEGDVFMHSQHDHGTGGHWCAKIIFFSLLAVLITLVGLIILENRGLSELEANSVESRYSGVLEGWLEDAPEDDHHDEHTLELNHHDEDEDHEEQEEVVDEVEKIEREVSDEEPVSMELPALPEAEDDEDGEPQQPEDQESEETNEEESQDDEGDVEDEEFLEADDDLPVIEKITAPAGQPFVEVEEIVSSEQPPDTLEEEEEYEKRQEELRREEEKASHMWLKLTVGAALLVATHAVMRRATSDRDVPSADHGSREETPIIDRRMTLIPEEPTLPVPPPKTKQQLSSHPFERQSLKNITPLTPPQEEDVEEEEEEQVEEPKVTQYEDKELYSEDEPEEEDVEDPLPPKKTVAINLSEKIERVVEPTKNIEKDKNEESEEEVPDDVEIIDEEQLEEEMEEEDEEISDVDDVELLTRLEAKYGRLPEPERPGQKHKDGGNSIGDEWPGEPSDSFWREELDHAERQLNQEWLD